MKTTQYLDALRSKLGLQSDYALAPVLGLTRAAVSVYRTKGVTFSDDVAIRVAQLLELPEGKVLADMKTEQAKSEVARKAWKRVADAMTAVLLTMAIAVPLMLIADRSEAGSTYGSKWTPSAKMNGPCRARFVF